MKLADSACHNVYYLTIWNNVVWKAFAPIGKRELVEARFNTPNFAQ